MKIWNDTVCKEEYIIKKYEIYVKNVKTGILQIDDNGKYCYKVYDDVLAELDKKKIPIFYQLRQSTNGFVEPIPVLHNRITNCAKHGQMTIVQYPGDDIMLKLIS